MRRAFLLLLACGCATAAPPGQITTSQPTIAQLPVQACANIGCAGSRTTVVMGDAPTSFGADIDAPPARVWLAVKKTYIDMDIPVTLEDAPNRQLGNKNFYKSRQLAGQPMPQLVDCGEDMTGPKASSYRIYIASITSVAPNAKGGSNVQTVFSTTGQDLGGTSSDRIACASTGRFEALFLKKVAAELGK